MSRQASGLGAWALQRISAIYLAVYTLYMFVFLTFNTPESHAVWKAYFAHPISSVAMLLFFAALMIHAWVGIRDVLIDYVHPTFIRITLLTFFGTGYIACALWIAKVIFLAGVTT